MMEKPSTIFKYCNHKCCQNRFHNKMKDGYFSRLFDLVHLEGNYYAF